MNRLPAVAIGVCSALLLTLAAAPITASAEAVPSGARLWFEPISSSGESGFVARGRTFTARLTPARLSMAWREGSEPRRSQLHMIFVGASSRARLEAMDRLSGKVQYLIGNDPAKWRTDVPMYARVRSADLYPGIDAVFYDDGGGQLEYDLIVAPGADPSAIILALDGVDRLTVDEAGNLVMRVDGRDVIQRKPFVYQPASGGRQEVRGSWRLQGRHRVGFQIGRYDRSKPLVIDPVVVYSTYLGGSEWDMGWDIATDTWGNTYVAGHTQSSNFPLAGPDPDPAGIDAFVASFNSSGTPRWVTYLGGTGPEWARAIAVDRSGGYVYVTGYTDAMDFPTTPGAFQPVDPDRSGTSDAFVTVFSAGAGTLVSSTYLGDTNRTYPGAEMAYGIAVDGLGYIYVSGLTSSDAFPTTAGAFQSSLDTTSGLTNAFVSVLDPAGSYLAYSTYLGAGQEERPRIAVHPKHFGLADGFVVAGYTASTTFRTTHSAVQRKFGGGQNDGFVTRFAPLSPNGPQVYSTFLGGSSWEFVGDVETDPYGNIYVAGGTNSTDFPTTPGVFQPTAINLGIYADAFVTKLDWRAGFVYSTYLGGAQALATGIAVDAKGVAYVTGLTTSLNFPLMAPLQPFIANSQDVFVTKIAVDGGRLLFSTYLGGVYMDEAQGIAVDGYSNAYVTGGTWSDFPTVNAFWPTAAGNGDAFVAAINTNGASADLAVTASASPNAVAPGDTVAYSIEVTNNGPAIATDLLVTFNGSGDQALWPPSPSDGWCTQTASGGSCQLPWLGVGASLVIRFDAIPATAGSIGVDASVSAKEPDPTVPNTATASVTVQ